MLLLLMKHSLNSPSRQAVWEHAANCPEQILQVDPYMKIVGKMEDEVPAFFKRMRYPFAISKSALFAVGSPHTWPGLLAALVWLTDLLCYSEKAVSCPPMHSCCMQWQIPQTGGFCLPCTCFLVLSSEFVQLRHPTIV